MIWWRRCIEESRIIVVYSGDPERERGGGRGGRETDRGRERYRYRERGERKRARGRESKKSYPRFLYLVFYFAHSSLDLYVS